MNSFLTGLGGVAVGALIATAFGTQSGASPIRTTPLRLEGLERAIAQLHASVRTLAQHSAAATGTAQPEQTRGGTPKDETLARPKHARRLPIRAFIAEPERLMKGAQYPEVLAREIPRQLPDVKAKFMLWRVTRVIEKFGRPNGTSIVSGHPSFTYRFKDQDGRTRRIQFGFVDGLVFTVFVR